MKAVILAGGLGTRISSIAQKIPKPMIKVSGVPVLERQLLCLKKEGICDFIIVTGYLGEVIESYFGNGAKLGIRIEYFREDSPLGTGGALFRMKDRLKDDFLLINGDLVFDICLERFVRFHKDHNALLTLLTHPNDHPHDSTIIVENDDGCVTAILDKSDSHKSFRNRSNSGIHLISPDILSAFSYNGKVDFDKDVLKKSISTGRVFSYNSTEYVRDMGTKERLCSVCEDVSSGIVEKKNLSKKQRAVFVDRDGTLNSYKGFITSPDDIALLPGVGEAVRILNQKGYPVIVITNQAVIARGDCTLSQLRSIHDRLEALLGEKGAYVNAIYFCPHHPDKGFENERAEYKIRCTCRKPEPGLLYKASEDFNIDLSVSYMVGDSITDIEAGKKAGCKTAFLLCGKTKDEPSAVPVFDDLLDFAERIEDYAVI